MTTKTLAALALLALAGCVNGEPLAPITEKPEPTVLHRLVSQQGDSLRLMTDSSYVARPAGSRFSVVGRYWFGVQVNTVNRMCARPNSVSVADPYLDCLVWEDSPGVLSDPGSAFLRDGAVKSWTRIR